jgi:uncharacterized membrane protein
MADHPHPAGHHPERGLQFERMVFFSDAVFAIAITLLVLDLKLPPDSHGVVDMATIGDKLLAFGLSFMAIGSYWLRHHQLFGGLQADDTWTRVVNLAFLASIAFLPFPTAVIAEFPATPSSVRFYALSIAAVGLQLALLTAVARRPNLVMPGETFGGTVNGVIVTLATPLVFLISAIFAGEHRVLTMRLWWLVIPALIAASRIGDQVQRLIDRPSA